jgi:hypothetical protein
VSHSIHLSPAPDAGPFFETAQHTTGRPLAPPHRQLKQNLGFLKSRGLWAPFELLLSAPFSITK